MSIRPFLIAALLVLNVSFFWTSTARAQTEEDARILFQQGNAQLQRALASRGETRQRALRSALTYYHRSLRFARARSVLFNIGLCYEHLERYQDAFAYFFEVMQIEGISEEDRRDAQTHIDAIRPRVALVEVTTRPPGATIFVDRTDLSPVGVTPVTVATQPGEHRIIATLEGYEDHAVPFTSALGETREVEFELNALPATVHFETQPNGAEIRLDREDGELLGTTPCTITVPAGRHRVYATTDERSGREIFEAPPGGEITVEVSLAAPTTPGLVTITVDVPNAVISVDGEEVQAPVEQLRLAPGMHRISVLAGDEYQSWSAPVELGPGHDLTLRVHLATVEPVQRFGFWPNVAMAAASVVGLAAVATGGWALFLHADLDEIRETCQQNAANCYPESVLREEAETIADKITRLSIATDVLIGTAAAVGIAAFTLMLLNRDVEDRSNVRISLAPTQGGALFSLSALTRMSP